MTKCDILYSANFAMMEKDDKVLWRRLSFILLIKSDCNYVRGTTADAGRLRRCCSCRTQQRDEDAARTQQPKVNYRSRDGSHMFCRQGINWDESCLVFANDESRSYEHESNLDTGTDAYVGYTMERCAVTRSPRYGNIYRTCMMLQQMATNCSYI